MARALPVGEQLATVGVRTALSSNHKRMEDDMQSNTGRVTCVVINTDDSVERRFSMICAVPDVEPPQRWLDLNEPDDLAEFRADRCDGCGGDGGEDGLAAVVNGSLLVRICIRCATAA